MNRAVQVTMTTPIHGARLYRRDLPKDLAKILVDYSNLLNKDSTSTTVLETWRSTKTVESAFQKMKETNKWSISSLGNAGFCNRKFETAEDLFKGRWSSYTSY